MGVVVAGRVLGPGVMTIAAVLLPPDPEPAEDWPALYALGTEPPPPPDPPDEPEPPLDTPDWATLLDHLDTAQATLATAQLAIEDCAAELFAARQWVEEQQGAL